MIPFGVQRFMFYKGRRLYGPVVKAISRPGVLVAVTSKIAEKGLDVTYCSTRTVKAAERGKTAIQPIHKGDARGLRHPLLQEAHDRC